MRIQKTVTSAKLEANQKNASKSTGPKTAVGKTNMRGNAVKHGLTASSLMFAPDGKPIHEELADLQEALRLQYGDNILTEILIDNVVVDCWRQRQGFTFEERHLSQGSNPFYAQGEMRNIMRYNQANRRTLLKNLEMLEKLRADQPDIPEEAEENPEPSQSRINTVATSPNRVGTETAPLDEMEEPTFTEASRKPSPHAIEAMNGRKPANADGEC